MLKIVDMKTDGTKVIKPFLYSELIPNKIKTKKSSKPPHLDSLNYKVSMLPDVEDGRESILYPISQ